MHPSLTIACIENYLKQNHDPTLKHIVVVGGTDGERCLSQERANEFWELCGGKPISPVQPPAASAVVPVARPAAPQPTAAPPAPSPAPAAAAAAAVAPVVVPAVSANGPDEPFVLAVPSVGKSDIPWAVRCKIQGVPVVVAYNGEFSPLATPASTHFSGKLRDAPMEKIVEFVMTSPTYRGNKMGSELEKRGFSYLMKEDSNRQNLLPSKTQINSPNTVIFPRLSLTRRANASDVVKTLKFIQSYMKKNSTHNITCVVVTEVTNDSWTTQEMATACWKSFLKPLELTPPKPPSLRPTAGMRGKK